MLGMLGLILTLAISALISVQAATFLVQSTDGRSRATTLGLAGLIGLGTWGTWAFFVKNLPYGGFLNMLGLGVCFIFWDGHKVKPIALKPLMRSIPTGLGLLAMVPVSLATLVGVVGTLSPSLASDWDTIAYHLAVPKILGGAWFHPISFIHHSFFPSVIDVLFGTGLQYGGQAGAKAFTLAFFLFGCLAIYGLAKDRYGKTAGLWAMAGFATIPVAVWETGTGYIDVAHGLYAGLGAWMVFQGIEREKRAEIIIGGILLGFAAGSKYTGLQALIGVGLVAIVLAMRSPKTRQSGVLIAAGLSLVICAPWYIRNTVVSGNPVYPFFYERFGGKWWNQNQADVYKIEQKTFGVSPDGPLSLPHAILGLAYQPGRYINPGQKLQVIEGVPVGATGNELGAIGAPVLAALVLGLVFWRRISSSKIAEPATLAWIVIGLVMWAFLSQQSRYMLSFAPALCLILGGLVASTKIPRGVAIGLGALVVVQGLWTGYLAKDRLLTPSRMRVAFGMTDQKEYLRRGLPFYEAAEYLNEVKAKRVALFDEVFGFYLDVPYFWAGYGHTNEMDYEILQTGDQFVAQLKKLGIDRVYVSFAFNDPEFVQRWMGSMGFGQTPTQLNPGEREALLKDVQSRWRVLLAEAVLAGKIQLEKPTRAGVIFKLAD